MALLSRQPASDSTGVKAGTEIVKEIPDAILMGDDFALCVRRACLYV